MTRALRRLLRPLVRLLIAEQITFPVLNEELRALYVEVSDEDFSLADKPQSASRTALLTGIHRREVKRLREGADPDDRVPEALSLHARLIADWNALPQFTDAEGRPLPLNRSSRRPGPSIRDLAETAGQDIRPQAILDEWLRQGVVEVADDGRIHLKSGSFVAESGFEAKTEFFGRIIGAHIAAGSHNLRGGKPPMLDQVVYYGHLTPESLERLSLRGRELALLALREWNREAAQCQKLDEGDPRARGRIHFGAYAASETGETESGETESEKTESDDDS